MSRPDGPAGRPAMRVLVVDDEANLRFAVERRLRRAGMHTVTAATARQAVENLQTDAFDVVICDLKMPGGDGTSVLKWLGSYSPSTKVIVVSAFVTSEFRARFEPTPGLRIIEKPVDLEVLVREVDELGARRGFYGNAIEVELFDYVQMVALSGRDKLIEVHTDSGAARIWFDTGEIVHVEFGGLRGDAAFYAIMGRGRGTFREILYRPAPARSVTRSSTHLLMETVRRADEAARTDLPVDSSSASSGTEVAGDLGEAAMALTADPDLVLDPEHSGPIDLEPAADSSGVFDDPEMRKMMLEQFWEYPGVTGVAIISSTGKVLAEDIRGNEVALTLAGFYLRGAGRIARALGYNVFDGVISRHRNGQQLLMMAMGATSVLLAIEIGCDPEVVRAKILDGGP